MQQFERQLTQAQSRLQRLAEFSGVVGKVEAVDAEFGRQGVSIPQSRLGFGV